MERKLRQYRVTESLGDGIEVDSIFTVEGVYEKTRWEIVRGRITYPFRMVWWRLIPVRIYFSNLWDAICGRSYDD